jgi:hypothetical protein
MHFLCLVYGPSTRTELDELLDKFGPDQEYIQRNKEEPTMLSMDSTFNIVHEYIASQLVTGKPTYIVIAQAHYDKLDRTEIDGLEYDGLIVYGEDSKLRFYLSKSRWLYDWYAIGGRFEHHLYIKSDDVPFDHDRIRMHDDDVGVLVDELARALMLRYGLIGSTDRPGKTAAYLKDIDWKRLGDEKLAAIEWQYDLMMEVMPNIKSIETIREELISEAVPGVYDDMWKLLDAVMCKFYGQWSIKDLEPRIPEGESLWAIRLLAGKTREEMVELAYLMPFSPTYSIINGKLIEFDMFQANDSLPLRRSIRDRVLALDPMTVVSVVDIHN